MDDIDDGCMHYGSGIEDNHSIGAGCGTKWHRTCVLGAFPLDLLFWYSGECCVLDSRDPAMNILLLMLLSGYDIDEVALEVGYEAYKQVAPYMSSFVIIEKPLYRHSGELLKEVVSPLD